MTDREMEVNKNAITLQGDGFDIDLVLPDFNWQATVFLLHVSSSHSWD
jgi:hypothetical protein